MKGPLDDSLGGIEAIFLDLDGTIYLGGDLIDGAVDFLGRLEASGIRRFFLSNNSSKSVGQYLEKLQSLGIPSTEEDILLSTHDLLSWLDGEGVTETYLVGTEGMREMLEAVGVNTKSESPQYVVLGYDTEITYEKLSSASIHLHNGVPMVASHPDIVCPSPDGGLPDTGAYMDLFEATTGVRPVHVCGKPNAGMILHKVEELGLRPEQCAMVGDRLYTDMEMAERAGVHGILVLSGEATMADLAESPQNPSLVVDSVSSLL
ncbi:MAG: HAD-IIA family hydrolase [Candidatus Thalassarchaeaceae archaeon]|jgi:4-nitrophenyl phosphatase/NagD protein|nr:HAD family hydrolase [Euryarchaeota archaeon]MDP6871351.1 HAD-IIA family hydrolase [Candidatus Thalassarchaeaceae archaeon]|tara:strand:- start:3013 stop:3798 length:786 start_codon:yes stop_codon:yes gene_type:complete